MGRSLIVPDMLVVLFSRDDGVLVRTWALIQGEGSVHRVHQVKWEDQVIQRMDRTWYVQLVQTSNEGERGASTLKSCVANAGPS